MGQIHFLSDALHEESIACLKAIEFATEVGFGRIIIETDSTVLATALLSNELDNARIGVLFREAKFPLFTSFIEFKVHVCKRVCNSVAHVLAPLMVPICLREVPCIDMTLFMALYPLPWLAI